MNYLFLNMTHYLKSHFVALLLVIVALTFSERLSAQLRTSYFMEGSYFRTELNPALKPTRGYIAVPLLSGIHSSIGGNIPLRNNIAIGSAPDEITPAMLSKYPKLGKNNNSSRLNILGVGFYTRNGMFWNFGANLREETDYTIPRRLYELESSASTGTFTFDNITGNTYTFIDAYVGTSITICDFINIGARVKFLTGLVNGRAHIDKLTMNNGTVDDFSLHVRLNSIEFDNSNFDGTDESFTHLEDGSDIWRNVKSFGGAIDLGVELRLLNDRLKVSAAVTDLGFIRWAGSSRYSGEMSADTTTIDAPEEMTGYTTRINCDLNAGVEYNFCQDILAVGLLSHTRFYNSHTTSELTASLNVRPTNWITLTASHTLLNGNRPGIFGAAINVHPAGINIFAGMDFIAFRYESINDNALSIIGIPAPIVGPRNGTSMNIYMGIGFNLARPKSDR